MTLTARRKTVAFPVPCAYCGVSLCAQTHTYDHILPRAHGGTTSAGNLAHACFHCNQLKADSLLPDFLRRHPHLMVPQPVYIAPPNRSPSEPVAAKSPVYTPAPVIFDRMADLRKMLPGELAGSESVGYIYTPPQGSVIKKPLRKILMARGVKVKWLPLLAV